ncbi:alpha/beta hydrolase [Actinoplanes sp. NPDC023801]|uniref:alpha/beta fold hydrolase n=1 Tax=Actinoplanes sp. NPDC023801 TaxID=3154595 RepID=UPI0033CEE294
MTVEAASCGYWQVMQIRDIARMSPAEFRVAMAAPGPADGFTSRHPIVGGLRLHVRSRPGGDAWVLLHGLAVSHRYLMPTAMALPGGVHVPDLPGFGLSERPRGAWDVREHATVVAAWMDATGLTGAAVLGNSFGCQVAVELAVRRPDLVSALVLVGPTVDPAAPSSAGQAFRWLRDLAGEDPRQARIISRDVRDAGPLRVVRTLRHSTRHPMARRLPLVTVPVLVLRGEHDRIAPPRWVAQAAALAPDGRAATVPRAAHNAVTTAGPSVAELATAFTGSLSSAPDAPIRGM